MHILEKIRRDRNLSKEEIMKKLGIAGSYYSMLVNGKRGISKSLAFNISKEFGLSLEEVFFSDSFHVTRNGREHKAG